MLNIFSDCKGLTSITIPNSVTSIGDLAFCGCIGLTSITIPNSVTSIGDLAFYGCIGLTSVVIPNSVTTIGVAAFMDCIGLTSVSMSNSITSISKSTFNGCAQLSSVTIPGSVKVIGCYVFSNCINLTEIICLGEDIPTTDIESFKSLSLSNIDLKVPFISISKYQNVSPWSTFKSISPAETARNGLYYSYSQKEEATVIGTDSSLTGVFRIPEYVVYKGVDYDVVSIGEKAFVNCKAMTSAIIPPSITSIGDNAFEGCSNINTMSIGKSVTSIGQSPFRNCSSLSSIIVNTDNVFYDSRGNCNALIETSTGKLIQGCNATVIPNDIASIGDAAFYGCSSITEVSIPSSVTYIGREAFQGCSGLTTVKIFSKDIMSVNRTENDNLNSFFGNQVTDYVIGENISDIGDNAFYGCSKMKTFTCYAKNLPTANSSVFEGVDLTGVTLYVPASAIDDYKSIKPWRRFGTILPIDNYGIFTGNMAITDKAEMKSLKTFNILGQQASCTRHGLYVIKDQNGNVRKIMRK